jgi:tetraacyldisaccharide 4'-kinase
MTLSTIPKPVLFLPAKLYEFGVRSRLALYEREVFKTHRLKAPVISVGNLSVGGTGKTPCVAYLARMLKEDGHEVAILSRGYKRSSTGRVEVSNGREILCTSAESGDEPHLLARLCPGVRVVVDRDRFAAGQWLESRAAISVFLLDDGYQHLRLHRDLNLLLVDATEDPAGFRMLPFGRLREPLAEMRRADAVIVTRSHLPFDRALLESVLLRQAREGTPIFYASHRMTNLQSMTDNVVVAPGTFVGKPVGALSGIARPGQFIADLTRLGMNIVLRRDFEDHHRYAAAELERIFADARDAGAALLITTDKDLANMPIERLKNPALPIFAAQIEFACEQESELQKLIRRSISQCS